ncbi:MAG: DsbA family protein [Candidatus Methanoperedens sp.]|nr:DsbA family protein [Candidatus Methanoperedens sp.]
MAKKKRAKPVKPEKKSNLTLIYAGLAVLLIAAVALYISTGAGPERPQEKLPSEGKFAKLNKPSTYEPGKVKITEFLKFNCGHCNQLNPQMPSIKQKYGDRVEITYKPMLWRAVPQDPGLRKSIEAYILAERMGKGEEMKNALFNAMFVDKKDLASEAVLVDIARSVGLGDEFATALKNGDAKNEAEANIQLAESYQVDETPTIIVNGNLKVTPTLVNGDMNAMLNNLDAITGSLLS